MKRPHGFTLVEVLVALAIVAIALMAGLQATTALARNAQRQSDILLAHLCAENELVKTRLSRQMPAVGDSAQPCEQAGRSFTVNLVVRPSHPCRTPPRHSTDRSRHAPRLHTGHAASRWWSCWWRWR